MSVNPTPTSSGFAGFLANIENTYVGKLVASFVRAFLGVYIAVFGAAVTGLLQEILTKGFSTAKDAVVALVLATLGGAFTAGWKALQEKIASKAKPVAPVSPPVKIKASK